MADKADKGKKRKRNTDGTSKPSKRLALDADKQVKISHHEAEKWAPVIGMNIPSTSNSTFHYSASAP
jgi:DNA-directed RNA polymerase I subunit RPA49